MNNKPTVEEMQTWNKRFKLDMEDTTRVIDTQDNGEYWTVHPNEAYNLCMGLNELYDELEWRKRIESRLRRKIAILTNGARYTYFKGHSNRWGVCDNVDPLNDESPYPSLICTVDNEEDAERICSYLNEYEKDSFNNEKKL